MNYYVTREGRQYGPYSLADLQRYLAQGNIQPTDLARSEAMDQWVPVQQIVGNIAVPQPPPPPVSYGQVPVYGQGYSGAAVQPGMAPAGPVPPGLHWALVLLFGVLTCGIFTCIWIFVQAAFVNKLRTNSKPLVLYAIGMGGIFVGDVLAVLNDSGALALGGLMVLGCAVVLIVAHFSMKSALEEYYTRVEPYNLRLSGVMTFFFNTLYFQYHLGQIAEWKRTGVRPQRGVAYTQPELDAMRNRPPQG
jgi:hypothetical protein